MWRALFYSPAVSGTFAPTVRGLHAAFFCVACVAASLYSRCLFSWLFSGECRVVRRATDKESGTRVALKKVKYEGETHGVRVGCRRRSRALVCLDARLGPALPCPALYPGRTHRYYPLPAAHACLLSGRLWGVVMRVSAAVCGRGGGLRPGLTPAFAVPRCCCNQFPVSSVREIKVLKSLKPHENVVRLLEVVTSPGGCPPLFPPRAGSHTPPPLSHVVALRPHDVDCRVWSGTCVWRVGGMSQCVPTLQSSGVCLTKW